MGIDIWNVLLSIRMAQSAQLLLLANHPLKHAASTQAFVRTARKYGLDCKIIDMFGPVDTANSQQTVNWAAQGYTRNVGGDWLHENGTHRLHTKGCGEKHNQQDDTLFIGADGIRRALDGIIIGRPENFTMLMVKSAQGSVSNSRSCAHGSAPVTRRFNKLKQLPI